MVPKSGNPTWKSKKFKNEVYYKELTKHTKYIVEIIIPVTAMYRGLRTGALATPRFLSSLYNFFLKIGFHKICIYYGLPLDEIHSVAPVHTPPFFINDT